MIIDVVQATPSYTPVRTLLDFNTTICDETDVPFDDHLDEITLPVLYVGAAGGVGELGVYSSMLTSSREITTHIVQLLEDDMQAMDFGHADLFFAEDADELVWQPILQWIQAHSQPGVGHLK